MFGVQVSKPDCRDVPREVCHPVVKQVPKQVPSKYCDKIEVKKCEPVPQKVRGSAFLSSIAKHMASLSLSFGATTFKSQTGTTFCNGAFKAFIIVFFLNESLP